MTQTGKLIVLAGLAIVTLGVIVWVLGKLGFRGLPGDVTYKSENVRFYFPIVTCVALSIVVSVILWLFRK